MTPGDGVAPIGTLSFLPFIALPANSKTRVETCSSDKTSVMRYVGAVLKL